MGLLADATCRELDKVIGLSGGKTSKGTKHLLEMHGITSDKTQAEVDNKRKRVDDAEQYKRSEMFKQDKSRLRLLLESLRIVLKDLPFSFGESSPSLLIEEVFCDEETKKTPINKKNVKHSIVEMYAATKLEVTALIRKSKELAPRSFSLVTDFWSCPTTGAKYLGARVYFIDESWEFRSVLLGTRLFDPLFEQRVDGIREPFKVWLLLMLSDFRLSPRDFFSACTDAGSDVKGMMKDELHLRWGWCTAHMASAATKMACGIVGDKTKSKNPQMTALIAKISKTVCDVKKVQVMGSLFAFLAKHLADDDEPSDSNTTKLLDYKSHRFMGLTHVIRRILMKWTALKTWYKEHAKVRERKGKPPKYVFLLEEHHLDLQQLLSMFEPLTSLNFRSQAESANQVEVLMLLFRSRETVLNMNASFYDYRHSKDKPRSIQPSELTQLARKTRELLGETFHKNFFSRYTDPDTIATCSYLPEMALFLHPRYKHFNSKLGPIVRLCNSQRNAASPNTVASDVEFAVRDRVKEALQTMVADDASDGRVSQVQMLQEFSGDLALYEEEATPSKSSHQHHSEQIDDELRRWSRDTTTLEESSPGSNRAESVLMYWKRAAGRYQLLSRLARSVFAAPCSSAQIERDFGQSGNTTTPLRAKISAKTLDMTAFLKANVSSLDLTQCTKIPRSEAALHYPTASMAALGIGEFSFEQIDQTMQSQFSSDVSMH